MKNLRTAAGASRPFYEEPDVERMCEDELRAHGYYPSAPSRVNIERFIEKRFGVTPRYEEMREGILGFSRFGAKGMLSMHISQALVEEGSQAAERRVNTTLAHEAGHGLLHMHLFALGDYDSTLFGNDPDVSHEQVMCRGEREEVAIAQRPVRRAYDGKWWELQANMVIGPLLMPAKLVVEALGPFRIVRGSMGLEEIDPRRREEAVRQVADVFDVNPAAARIRLDKMYKPSGPQLTF